MFRILSMSYQKTTYPIPSPSQAFSSGPEGSQQPDAASVYMFNQALKHKETERDYGITQDISRTMRLDAGYWIKKKKKIKKAASLKLQAPSLTVTEG